LQKFPQRYSNVFNHISTQLTWWQDANEATMLMEAKGNIWGEGW
jgi:hypothetical protein